MTKPNPILIEKIRGNVVESFHRGAICMVGPDSSIIFSLGDISRLSYPRSALKFFQQILLIESEAAERFHLTDAEIAIACGSHGGEDRHVNVVRSMLQKAGLQEADLQCGAHPPFDEETQNTLIRNELLPKPIHNNCSGKHAAFLLLAKHLGYSIENYLDPKHPLQQLIKQAVADMHECEAHLLKTAMDGCSAPMFALSLYTQAIGYKNLCHPTQFNKKRQAACQKIISAALRHPEMLAGKNRFCTEILQATQKKIIAKTGAEGVYSFGFLKQGVGCTLKIDDGTSGMQYHVAQKILEQSGPFEAGDFANLTIHQERTIRNWNGHVTGRLNVVPLALLPQLDTKSA